MKLKEFLLLAGLFFLCISQVTAQISPGDLSNAHAYLEGVNNCTKCHDVGNKVTRAKCLACHQIIKTNIQAKKGYHASAEVTGKECVVCHNEHHGKTFQIIRFDKKTFNHNKTGFELKGVHARKDCNSCHKVDFIKDTRLKTKPSTFMGLNQACLNCHEDFHKGSMSRKCNTCHTFESFKKGTVFNHNSTRFPLLGKHKTVNCDKCHITEMINGKPVQKFRGLEFSNCTACHKDIHENKFGQNCRKCHNEESFRIVKGMKTFDHDKTDFKLIGKHAFLACKSCHKTSLTAPVKHDHCTSCHTDYHKGDFAKNGISPDCNQCHSNNGFTPSQYTVENHNLTKFPLEGAHLATSCKACHQKQGKWSFRNMGSNCIDCHTNVHKGFIQDKYIVNNNCSACHKVSGWKNITFDHNKTNFKLDGSHARQQYCSECHYTLNEKGVRVQQFKGLSTDCASCHKNNHVGQFDVNGKTDCTKCHETTTNWTKTKFDHNTSRFKLEGAHAQVKCNECHKEKTDEKGKYIQYKFKGIECSNCHS